MKTSVKKIKLFNKVQWKKQVQAKNQIQAKNQVQAIFFQRIVEINFVF